MNRTGLVGGLLSLVLTSSAGICGALAADRNAGAVSDVFQTSRTPTMPTDISTYPGAPSETGGPYVELYRSWPGTAEGSTGGYRYCAGTLVHRSRRFVVTSAQCSESISPTEVFIVTRREQTEPGRFHRVKRITIHPEWNEETLDHDIAVWELETPARGMRPARLADLDAPTGTEFSALRIGLRLEDSMPRLLEIRLPSLDPAECGQPSDRAPAETICAGFAADRERSCQGDPGGPLLLNSDTGRPVLVGVTSTNPGCLNADLPGIYTRVSRSSEFIRHEIRASSSSRIP